VFALQAQQLFEQALAEVQVFAQQTDFDDDVCMIGVEVAHSIGTTNGDGTSGAALSQQG
jgi:hypothetical protein